MEGGNKKTRVTGILEMVDCRYFGEEGECLESPITMLLRWFWNTYIMMGSAIDYILSCAEHNLRPSRLAVL
jgi:hypothetical protein